MRALSISLVVGIAVLSVFASSDAARLTAHTPDSTLQHASTASSYRKAVEAFNGIRRFPSTHWTLDDLDTHNFAVTDLHGGHHGSMSAAARAIDGRFEFGQDDAKAIDGVAMCMWDETAFFSVPASALQDAQTSGPENIEFGFDFWVRPRNTSGPFPQAIFEMQGAAGTVFSAALTSGGACGNESDVCFVVHIGASGSPLILNSAAGLAEADQWNHISLMFNELDGSTYDVTLFVDGALDDQGTLAKASFSGSALDSGMIVFQLYGCVDEVAVYDRTLTLSDIRIRTATGHHGACAARPCFSGTECTSLGSETYSCGSCPVDYEGDGISCTPVIPTEVRARYNCQPPVEELSNPNYCADNCPSRMKCYICSLNYDNELQIQSRNSCRAAVERGDLPYYVADGPQIPRSPLTYCQYVDEGYQNVNGINTRQWLASECSEGLPTATAAAMQSKSDACGRDRQWKPFSGNTPGLQWGMRSGACLWLRSAVMYAERDNSDNVIVCTGTRSSASGTVTKNFSPAECGGKTVTSDHIGVIGYVEHCGTRSEDIRVLQPALPTGGGDAGFPGITWWVSSPCSTPEVSAIYLKRDSGITKDYIWCFRPSSASYDGYTFATGENTYYFKTEDCFDHFGENILPDTRYKGVQTASNICAHDEDWRVINPGEDAQGPGVYWWMVENPCSNPNLGVLFLKV